MKFQSIQALRALAAIMVIVFHSSIIIPQPDIKGTLWTIPGFTDFGFFGVNLFFVISGFIIADVLSKESFSILSYFKKRFFRIYPFCGCQCCWVCITIISANGSAMSSFTRPKLIHWGLSKVH
ncbi:acyltransferase family protein [Citrobacter werkmanii]|uniref:acyltransferase family protein n=1 Tax=Citrobacter werkmanii TaxID=67827 RepID=UPI001577736C|nr:acyltransferase [Citrobacter werkmanii]NTY80603.1 acyltransferase [Citrobacter werkmanii]